MSNPETMFEKAHLTDQELIWIINEDNTVRLDSVEKITDAQAQILGGLDVVIIPKVGELTDRQAECLGEVARVMLGVTKINDCQVRSLSNCKSLSLLALKDITPVQCRYLQNVSLAFYNLRSISYAVALALGKNESVVLSGVVEISPNSIAVLNPNSCLNLDGLETLTDALAEALGKRALTSVALNGLRQLTENQTEMLSNCSTLLLNGLSSITDRQAQLLGKCESLWLNGLTQISDETASYLSAASELHLYGIEKLSDHQAQILSACKSVWLGKGAGRIRFSR